MLDGEQGLDESGGVTPRESLLSSDPIAMCELLVGLPEVTVLDVTDTGGRLRVTVETRPGRPACPSCGAPVRVKDRDTVELTDLPCFGQPAVLVWRKFRWGCPQGCGSFLVRSGSLSIAPAPSWTGRGGTWPGVDDEAAVRGGAER